MSWGGRITKSDGGGGRGSLGFLCVGGGTYGGGAKDSLSLDKTSWRRDS